MCMLCSAKSSDHCLPESRPVPLSSRRPSCGQAHGSHLPHGRTPEQVARHRSRAELLPWPEHLDLQDLAHRLAQRNTWIRITSRPSSISINACISIQHNSEFLSYGLRRYGSSVRSPKTNRNGACGGI
jgi:hypothetical protein